MMMVSPAARPDAWRRRALIPHYQVAEAARYAGISPQTVAAWHKATLSPKDHREELSYMQLIEVAVVAAFRKAGVRLPEIRAARDYVKQKLRKEFPFAEFRFKSEGKNLWIPLEQIEGGKGKGKLLKANQAGQLAWGEILGRLQEFEYEGGRGVVVRWRVAGPSSPITIDPRIAFGAPAVGGTPTWVLKGRWQAGEPDSEIAADFNLTKEQVRAALAFERVAGGKEGSRLH